MRRPHAWILTTVLVATAAHAGQPERRAARRLASHAVGVASPEAVPGHMADPKTNLVIVQRWTGQPLFAGAMPAVIARVKELGNRNGGGRLKLPALARAADLPEVLRLELFGGHAPPEVEPWIADMLLRARILESVSPLGHINTNLMVQRPTPVHPDRGFRSVVSTDLGPGTHWIGDGATRQADTNDILTFRGKLDRDPLLHFGPDWNGLRLTTLIMDVP